MLMFAVVFSLTRPISSDELCFFLLQPSMSKGGSHNYGGSCIKVHNMHSYLVISSAMQIMQMCFPGVMGWGSTLPHLHFDSVHLCNHLNDEC